MFCKFLKDGAEENIYGILKDVLLVGLLTGPIVIGYMIFVVCILTNNPNKEQVNNEQVVETANCASETCGVDSCNYNSRNRTRFLEVICEAHQ